MEVSSEWYGCPFAKAENEALVRILKHLKGEPIHLITTCAVKEETEKRMLKRIAELKNKRLLIYGCLVDLIPSKIREIVPNAYLVGTGHLEQVGSVFSHPKKELLGKGRSIKLGVFGEKPIAIVPISEGCASHCTFCATRLARGSVYTYPLEKIVSVVKEGLKMGYNEFWFTSQDTATYGLEKGLKLVDLLEEIVKIKGKFKVRIGMGNPRFFLNQIDRLLGVYQSGKFFTFLHAPVQSGSESVVKHMKRNHTVKDYITLVNKFRGTFPNGTVWTDIITGYPSETEKDFEKTLEVLKQTKPDKVNVSRYGVRSGTEAAKLKDLPGWIKKERSRAVVKLMKEISLKINKKYVGKTVQVFFDQEGRGRTDAYKLVVGNGKLGEWKQMKIIDATAGYLIGK